MKKILEWVPEYFYQSTFLTCTYFEYSRTFKIKVLVHVLDYLELVLVPNTGEVFIKRHPSDNYRDVNLLH